MIKWYNYNVINMKTIKNIISISFTIVLIVIIILNIFVFLDNKDNMYIIDDLEEDKFDCILILGAGVENEKPSPILEDRLLTGIELYKRNFSKKIVVSGDHGQINYDEVNVMKNYLIENGIPSQDIFMDHAGFSTYDSIYRIKDIFDADKVLIVTQKFHLYRALHISKEFNLETVGVIADQNQYSGQFKRELREIIARAKDVIKSMFKPKPKYLGEIIPIDGNGNITNDK